jgi:hypothetical protein
MSLNVHKRRALRDIEEHLAAKDPAPPGLLRCTRTGLHANLRRPLSAAWSRKTSSRSELVKPQVDN